jgi:hypothetical protein
MVVPSPLHVCLRQLKCRDVSEAHILLIRTVTATLYLTSPLLWRIHFLIWVHAFMTNVGSDFAV